jgi:hypothetical protein
MVLLLMGCGGNKDPAKIQAQLDKLNAQVMEVAASGDAAKAAKLTADVLKLTAELEKAQAAALAKPAKSGGNGKANPASDFSYDLTKDGKGILIKGYTGGPGKVVVPAKIEDIPVTEIGAGVFNGESTSLNMNAVMREDWLNSVNSKENKNAGITSITLPNTVTKIGYKAFANTAITKFDMPDSVTLLDTQYGDSDIFEGCKQLAEITFSDNIELLPGLATFSLPALKKVKLPKKLKAIGDYALSGCPELSELILDNGITSLQWVKYKAVWNTRKLVGQPGWKLDGTYVETWPREGTKQDEEFGEGFFATDGDSSAFSGDSKLPLKMRQRLKDLGYKDSF